MKIRSGFVSNSSSSSFLIIGRQVQFSDIKDGDLVYVKGKGINDGDDVFELTPGIKAFMKGKNIPSVFTFYRASKPYGGIDYIEDGIELEQIKIEEGDEAIWLDKDYCSTTEISEFKARYEFEFKEATYRAKYVIQGSYISIIGQLVEDENLGKEERFEDLWCHAVIDDIAYMIKVNNKKELFKCGTITGRKRFFHVRDFCEDGVKLKPGILKDMHLYSMFEHRRISSINEVKRIKKGKKHEDKEELCF